MRRLLSLLSHGFVFAAGFALGIYMLPILMAEKAPSESQYQALPAESRMTARFDPALKGSDFLHWGEGEVIVTPTQIAHKGRLAPGPDYKLYLVPDFVEDEAAFLAIKDKAARIGDVKSYSGFILPVPAGVDVNAFTTVVIWCESFNEFISAAKYR